MGVIQVELARKFMFGDDVVLVAMDGDGVTEFESALRSAVQQGSWRLDCTGLHHDFLIETGHSDIEMSGLRVVWRFDRAKASEILDALNALQESGRPGHQYVDITRPTDTLVLSRDEYIEQT